jgi:alkylated DNA nucleotide flippase Atl1
MNRFGQRILPLSVKQTLLWLPAPPPGWWVTPLHALAPEKKVPWRRVVGTGGKISLGGEGYTVQRKILELEGAEFDEKGKIPIYRFGLVK